MTRYFTRLTSEHQRPGFDCGEPDLNRWFHEMARQAQDRHNSARTWVLVDDDVENAKRPLAYYSLAAHALDFESLPHEHAKGQPGTVPAALLARLAVDREYQDQGLGTAALRHAVAMTLEAHTYLAVPLMVVDALHDDAARFYEHWGFVRLPDATPSRIRLTTLTEKLAEALE